MAEFTPPPTIDPGAAVRWQAHAPALSPWLHEEVGRRMEDRLQWIMQKPEAWCSWQPLRAGLAAHQLVAERYPQAECYVVEGNAQHASVLREALVAPWWTPGRWRQAKLHWAPPATGGVQMLWANMALHSDPNPQQLLHRWHDMLEVDGYLMFSCLGPDTLKELRAVYAEQGWPVASHEFTDMHDWGDMLVQAGFAEPVMDMERITLSYSSAEKLRGELRELGRNLHPGRFAGLRGRKWLAQLDLSLARQLARAEEDGRLVVTFEVIYGHAFKPQPKVRMQGESIVSIEQMQQMLRGSRTRGE